MESRHTKLITREKDGVMRIDHDALRQVLMRPEIGDSPVAIVSIAGCMRTGKSFLLNFVERYLREEGWKNSDWMGDGQTSANVESGGSGLFFWKSGRKRTTTGVRISTEVFRIPRKEGGQVAVLLMDTQGLFDHETPENVNITLLTLSTLMSSVQIFNALRQLNSQDLRYLKTCVNFAMATAQAREPYFVLQDLIFLVRDFPEDEDIDGYSCPYGFEYGDEYLKGIIDSNEGGKEQIAIRQRIKECFTNVKCFPMPFPGEKVTKKGFGGRNDELADEFKMYVKVFVEEIAHPDRLQAKIARMSPLGKEMTAREILNMVAACDNIFATQMFEAESMMEANVKAYYASEYEEAIVIYDKMMKDVFDGSKPVEADLLQQVHSDAKKQALRRFHTSEKMGDESVKEFYRNHLEKMSDEHLESVIERNDTKLREEEADRIFKTSAALMDYESKMQQYSADAVDDQTLRERHERLLVEVLKKYQGKADEVSLREKTEAIFAVLHRLNERKRTIDFLEGNNKRKIQLHRLCAQLHSKCSKSWMENLKIYQSDETMVGHEKGLNKEITAEYYRNALTTIEFRCINRLNDAMKKNYNKAKSAVRQGQVMLPIKFPNLQEDMQRLELEQKQEEKVCLDSAFTIAENYAGELQNDVKNCISIEKLKQEKRPKQNAHRKMYCKTCSEELANSYEEVEQMLATKSEEAKKRNDENWEMMRNRMIAIIDSAVLDEEEALQAKMADRYIEEGELANHFQVLKKNLTENIGLKFLDFKSPRVAEEFKNLVNEKMEISNGKMQEKNKDNKTVRNVQTREVPQSSSWWQQLWEAIKSLFGMA